MVTWGDGKITWDSISQQNFTLEWYSVLRETATHHTHTYIYISKCTVRQPRLYAWRQKWCQNTYIHIKGAIKQTYLSRWVICTVDRSLEQYFHLRDPCTGPDRSLQTRIRSPSFGRKWRLPPLRCRRKCSRCRCHILDMRVDNCLHTEGPGTDNAACTIDTRVWLCTVRCIVVCRIHPCKDCCNATGSCTLVYTSSRMVLHMVCKL